MWRNLLPCISTAGKTRGMPLRDAGRSAIPIQTVALVNSAFRQGAIVAMPSTMAPITRTVANHVVTQFQSVLWHVLRETNALKVKPVLITHLAIVTYHRHSLSIVVWVKQKRQRSVGNLVREVRIRSVVLDKLATTLAVLVWCLSTPLSITDTVV